TTGTRPFEGDTPEQTVEAILTGKPVPPRQRNHAIPAKLERIIAKALEKDRTARYQSAAELRADVERLRRSASTRNRWLAAIAAALLLAFGVTLAGVRFGWFAEPPAAIQLTQRQLTANPLEDPVIRASISPNGQFVAYQDLAGIHVRQINTGETHSTLAPEGSCFR
ncbi:MAG: hypothetical protein ACKV22_08400, partial [Bryobacteraceae bacterium]